MEIINKALMSLVLVGIGLILITVIFPKNSFTDTLNERNVEDNVITIRSNIPEINAKFTNSAYEYTLKIDLIGEYNGDFSDLGRIDIVPFIIFKEKGMKGKIDSNDQDFFSVTQENPKIKETLTATIISKETPINIKESNSYNGRLNSLENIVLQDELGKFKIKLTNIKKKLFDRVPILGDDICWANFILECEEEQKFLSLTECKDDKDYLCKSETSMCGGIVNLDITDTECDSHADVDITVKGGKDYDITENFFITFWKKDISPNCVDQAIVYTDLTSRCYNDFLGQYEIKVPIEDD